MKKETYKTCWACEGVGNWYVGFPAKNKECGKVIICKPCILKALKKLTKKKKQHKI